MHQKKKKKDINKKTKNICSWILDDRQTGNGSGFGDIQLEDIISSNIWHHMTQWKWWTCTSHISVCAVCCMHDVPVQTAPELSLYFTPPDSQICSDNLWLNIPWQDSVYAVLRHGFLTLILRKTNQNSRKHNHNKISVCRSPSLVYATVSDASNYTEKSFCTKTSTLWRTKIIVIYILHDVSG